jgi:geranylgeranyl diphosphate synthase type I
MRTEVSAGQYLDVLAQVSRDMSIERASTIARYKSAKYTVERPLLFGAALADAPAPVRAAFSGYGLPLGEAFQLRDDILGVYGDPVVTGKPAGDDLREGKRTYLVAAAAAAADPVGRAALLAGLGDPELDEARVAQLREIIAGTGALARTERRIGELMAQALAALATVELDAEAAGVLVDLARVATQRGA